MRLGSREAESFLNAMKRKSNIIKHLTQNQNGSLINANEIFTLLVF